MNVDSEVSLLIEEIKRLGTEQESGRIGVKFGTLFDASDQVFEALNGTLRAAKKRSLIKFEGQMLLKGAHDDVLIELVRLPSPSSGIGSAAWDMFAAVCEVRLALASHYSHWDSA
jgi:hypothetical protein